MGTRRAIAGAVALAVAMAAGAMVVRAAGPFKGHADLIGYQVVPTLSSPASGSIDVEISKDGMRPTCGSRTFTSAGRRSTAA